MKCNKSLLPIILLLVSSCNGNKNSEEVVDKGDYLSTIFVATDTHLLASNLVSEDDKIFRKELFTRDGRVQEYDYRYVEKLVEKTNEAKPKALIITGDLTFNGELDSHRELARILSGVNKDTKVLVIPGNHDVFNVNCYSYAGDKREYVSSIDYDEFKEIYKDFGYEGAISYHDKTCSYFYQLDENTVGLCIDTSISYLNYDLDMNIAGGAVLDEFIEWADAELQKITAKGQHVIGFTHHNLYVHNELFTNSYVIGNADKLIALYKKYNVKLNLSGHLHIQSIKENDGIYDIANGSMLTYSNSFGKIDIYEKYYEYNSVLVDEETKDYSYDVFVKKYNQSSKARYMSNFGEEEGPKICDFVARCNAYYFGGYYQEVLKIVSQNKKYYNIIANDSSSKYALSVLNVENKDQRYALIEK